jgi:hypothetical protein
MINKTNFLLGKSFSHPSEFRIDDVLQSALFMGSKVGMLQYLVFRESSEMTQCGKFYFWIRRSEFKEFSLSHYDLNSYLYGYKKHDLEVGCLYR